MYCIYCGSQNPDNANFCSNCGKEATPKTDKPQPKVHHPWMTEQQPQTREESQQQVQDQGEVPNARQAIWSRIKGWSRTQKILAGVVAFFLLLTCAVAIAGEPVESEPSTKDALIAVFEEKGYEPHKTLAGWWKHPDSNDALWFLEGSGVKSAYLTLSVSGNSLSAKNIADMQAFISTALPTWIEGNEWIESTAPKAFASSVDRAGFGQPRRKTFTPNNAEDIVGEYDEIRVVLQRERTTGGTPLIQIRLKQYD